jgi:hypothetical protein
MPDPEIQSLRDAYRALFRDRNGYPLIQLVTA